MNTVFQFIKDMCKILLHARKNLPTFVKTDINRTADLITGIFAFLIVLSITSISYVKFTLNEITESRNAYQNLLIKNQNLVLEIKNASTKNEITSAKYVQQAADLVEWLSVRNENTAEMNRLLDGININNQILQDTYQENLNKLNILYKTKLLQCGCEN